MDNTNTIDGQMLQLMLGAGSRWVLWLLIGLSVIALGVVLERIWFFVSTRRPSQMVARTVAALRESGPAAALEALRSARTMDAEVARACLEHQQDGPAAMEEHLTAAVERERVRYERGLAFLGTLGNNAPFIGLFGTVLGIVRSFHDLSSNTAEGTQAVMAGIAEALVATGVGLLVALPAVAAYNTLMRHVEIAVASADTLGHQILAFAKAERTAVPPASGEPGEG